LVRIDPTSSKIEDQSKNPSLQKAEDWGTRQTAQQRLGHPPLFSKPKRKFWVIALRSATVLHMDI